MPITAAVATLLTASTSEDYASAMNPKKKEEKNRKSTKRTPKKRKEGKIKWIRGGNIAAITNRKSLAMCRWVGG